MIGDFMIPKRVREELMDLVDEHGEPFNYPQPIIHRNGKIYYFRIQCGVLEDSVVGGTKK